MAARNNTIFDQFLVPVLRFFVDENELKRTYESIDWEAETQRLSNPTVVYPEYYRSQNFHGIQGGYLTANAATTYDAVTQYALPPNETLVRQDLLNAVQSKPRRILDLGCGTGSMTLLLQQRFPEADVIGLDMSPHMLVMAERKAQQAHLPIQWQHGLAEATGLPAGSVDLISIALLFHETPPSVAIAILREAHRLLRAGGEVLVLDGKQSTLRHAEWLTQIFEEPYIRDYAAASVDAWMGTAGFGAVRTQDVWLLHQLTRGVKGIAPEEADWSGDENWAVGVAG